MGYIDHIQVCNNHDLDKFLPFLDQAQQHIGWIRKDNVCHLVAFSDLFDFGKDKVSLRSHDNLTERMLKVARHLFENGLIEGWRDEPYRVGTRFGDEPLFLIERAAAPFFGVRAYGVHINGFVRTNDGLKMWIARRAKDRLICPGMLDNLVAGGQPAGLSLQENIIKECGEEANISPDLASQAQPVGTISYMMETDNGIKPDVMFCFDLELPDDFIPENTDGEVESFVLMDVNEVAKIVRDGFDFKFNCNLVVIDFLIRHGVLHPDNVTEYEELVRGLRR